ncbi:ABC transporter substrate-binding protein [Chelatococcus asaccharovorans]|uniref:Carbohydrate ABC transporter substrate-binding protein (CUT1 family) n=1 Tax=Chelatococcus asaccharovorans TaxID=28210 RepID=A0A2V3U3Q0_9HYPH|nr:ABC transporter substrate-binding protein [Chelatococcus asaccharovorans]PXW57355.1 carbohydrate ABC transporter substrate-binding protein (CUT1 family) [Chelatococcus asaccharovorans]
MFKRDFLKLLALTGLGFTALTGMASARMADRIDAPVTITFYNYNLASASAGADATRALIAEFEAAHPQVKIEAVGVPSNEIVTRLQADMAAGRRPDVAQLVFRDLIYIATDLGGNALEDMAGPEGYAALVNGLIPRGVDLGRVGDKTYGLAYTFSTPILFYNADLFRAAGLDPDKPPRTWADVKAAADAIVAKTDAEGFFPGAYGPADGTFVYQAILMSNGGKVRDGNRLTFANREGIEAVEMLRDMVKSGGHGRLDPANPSDSMASGKLGMFLYTSALQNMLSKAAKDKWDLRVAPLPAFGDKPTAPTNSGSALFSFSTDPLKQRASYELMKFLTSKHGYTIITSKIGYLPLRLDIVDDPAFLGPWTQSHPLIRPNLEQLERLTPNVAFPGPNYRQAESLMKEAVIEAVFGEGNVAEVLTAAQNTAQGLMPQN